ncbi:MAG: hypothetical protein GY762_12415 [Proteobacteria bacterium]|nr:hypothetical protein [Pseudomonadota bacterium]
MKRISKIVLVLMLCGFAGSAISSCKKKGPKTAGAEMAAHTQALRKQVKKVIKDKLRRENVMILVDDVDRYRAQLTLAWLNMSHNMQKNPNLSREEVQVEVDKFEEARVESLQNMAKARLAMREYVTAEEWKKLFPEPKKKKKDDEKSEKTEDSAEPESGDDPQQPEESAPEAEASADAPEKTESEE